MKAEFEPEARQELIETTRRYLAEAGAIHANAFESEVTRTGDDEEFMLAPALHRHVAFVAAFSIQHGRVGQIPDLIRAHPLEQRMRIPAAHPQFAKGCLVENSGRFAHGPLLFTRRSS